MFCGMMFVSKLLIAVGSVAASGIVAIEAHDYRGPQNRGVAQFPLHYVLHGVTVTSPPILLSNATDAPSLAALCSATPTCKGFTVGSGGGEPGERLESGLALHLLIFLFCLVVQATCHRTIAGVPRCTAPTPLRNTAHHTRALISSYSARNLAGTSPPSPQSPKLKSSTRPTVSWRSNAGS